MAASDAAKENPFLTEFWNLIKQDNLASAEHMARWAVATYPSLYLGRFLLGYVLREQHNLTEAKRSLRQAIRLWRSIEHTQHYPDAYLQMGLVFQEEGKPREARKAFERVIGPAPN